MILPLTIILRFLLDRSTFLPLVVVTRRISESNNALYKTEMVRTHGDFNGTADLEWATLLWVDWFNNRRLHGSIGMIPPSEFKSNYYTQREL